MFTAGGRGNGDAASILTTINCEKDFEDVITNNMFRRNCTVSNKLPTEARPFMLIPRGNDTFFHDLLCRLSLLG